MIVSSFQSILNIGLILDHLFDFSWLSFLECLSRHSFGSFCFLQGFLFFLKFQLQKQSQNPRWGLSNYFRSFSKIDFWCYWKWHPQSQKLIQLIQCAIRLLLLRARYNLVKNNINRTLVLLLSSHSHHRREALSSMAGSCWFIEQSLVFPRPVKRKIPESSMASIFFIRSCMMIVIF